MIVTGSLAKFQNRVELIASRHNTGNTWLRGRYAAVAAGDPDTDPDDVDESSAEFGEESMDTVSELLDLIAEHFGTTPAAPGRWGN